MQTMAGSQQAKQNRAVEQSNIRTAGAKGVAAADDQMQINKTL